MLIGTSGLIKMRGTEMESLCAFSKHYINMTCYICVMLGSSIESTFNVRVEVEPSVFTIKPRSDSLLATKTRKPNLAYVLQVNQQARHLGAAYYRNMQTCYCLHDIISHTIPLCSFSFSSFCTFTL